MFKPGNMVLINLPTDYYLNIGRKKGTYKAILHSYSKANVVFRFADGLRGDSLSGGPWGIDAAKVSGMRIILK